MKSGKTFLVLGKLASNGLGICVRFCLAQCSIQRTNVNGKTCTNTLLGAVLNLNDMTIEETNILHEKAKTRKDGVYSFRGNLWVVKDSKFIAFANPFGECYQRFGAFNMQIGKVERYDRKQKLTEWLRSQ